MSAVPMCSARDAVSRIRTGRGARRGMRVSNVEICRQRRGLVEGMGLSLRAIESESRVGSVAVTESEFADRRDRQHALGTYLHIHRCALRGRDRPRADGRRRRPSRRDPARQVQLPERRWRLASEVLRARAAGRRREDHEPPAAAVQSGGGGGVHSDARRQQLLDVGLQCDVHRDGAAGSGHGRDEGAGDGVQAGNTLGD